jgi:hypothetical protein
MQFTLEIGGDKTNFLDITIIKNEDFLIFDWYHKPTFSGRYLNFLSAHPLSQKRGTIMSMVDRTFVLSDPKFHRKNIEFIANTLLINDYPAKFIFETINSRIKSLINQSTIKQIDNNTDMDTTNNRASWFLLPYIPTISDKFKTITNKFNVKLALFSLNKLSRFIKVQKDVLSNNLKKNVVYKIMCKDCDASYVGQTSRKLKTRITEHRNHINWNTNNHFVIAEHRLNCNHDFDWENIKILDNKRFFFLSKRLTSCSGSMLHAFPEPPNSLSWLRRVRHASVHEIFYLEKVRLLPAKRKPDRQKARWKLSAWADDQTCKFSD